MAPPPKSFPVVDVNSLPHEQAKWVNVLNILRVDVRGPTPYPGSGTSPPGRYHVVLVLGYGNEVMTESPNLAAATATADVWNGRIDDVK